MAGIDWQQSGGKRQQTVIGRMRPRSGEEPCQPLDYSYNNPLDLSRTERSNPAVRCHHSLVKAGGRNFILSNLHQDWSDDVEGGPWRYTITSDTITTSPTPELSQSDEDQDNEVSLSEGENSRRVSRGFSDSEELFVFQATRSEVKYLNLWSFSRKSRNPCDISRYSPSGQADDDEQPNHARLLEEREDREDCIELLDQPSDGRLLLEHENSILCDPELQMFPIAQSQSQLHPTDNNCQEFVSTHSVSPSLPEIGPLEIPSPQLLVSDSESGRVEFLDDDLMIDLP